MRKAHGCRKSSPRRREAPFNGRMSGHPEARRTAGLLFDRPRAKRMATGSHPREGGDPQNPPQGGFCFSGGAPLARQQLRHPRGFQQTHVWSSGRRLSTDACPVIQRPAARRAFRLIAHAQSAWLPEVIPAKAGGAFQRTPVRSSRRSPPKGGFRAFRLCTSSCRRDDDFANSSEQRLRQAFARRPPSRPAPLTTPASPGTIAPCPFPTSITACGC